MDYWTGILEWTTGMAYFFGFYTFLVGSLIFTGYKYPQGIYNHQEMVKISSKPSFMKQY